MVDLFKDQGMRVTFDFLAERRNNGKNGQTDLNTFWNGLPVPRRTIVCLVGREGGK